jgi:hypothetical protein
MKRGISQVSQHVIVLLAYAVFAVAMTWPLATHLSTHLVNAKWFYDAMTNIMILGTRVQYMLGRSTLGLYDNYFCAPIPYSIVFNENLFGLSLIYLPIYLITGSYLLSYNILLLLCLTLSGYGVWLLVRYLTNSSLAGFVCGVAYAFCPYVLFELGRVQLVAAQWIPLCVFFLHRTIETGRLKDMAGLGFFFVMQVGSCLYYTLFLLVLFGFVGIWLLVINKRTQLKFWLQLVVVMVVTGVVVGVMIYPYVKTRSNFALTRSTEKARQYAGKMSSLVQVYPENKTLGFLRFDSVDGSEQVAFPGFTVVLLALASLGFALVKAYKRGPPDEMKRHIVTALTLSILVFFSTIGAAVVFGGFLWAIPIVLGGLIYWRKRCVKQLLPSTMALYLYFLFFSLILFLGIQPYNVNNQPVYGLYYYFYTYIPGFDGIRYVSRQIILIMLSLVILAGFAVRDVLTVIKRPGFRAALCAGVVVVILFEFRNAPMSLQPIPTFNTLPGSYQWLARHRGNEPVAAIPGHYIGYFGALHNYYTLFHRRRTLNGKSSWIPPITRMYINEMRRFPRESGRKFLRTFGVKYLVVHAEELDPEQAKRIIYYLKKNTEKYKLLYESEKDSLFELLDDNKTPPPRLASTPTLPRRDVVSLHNWQISSTASQNPQISLRAYDRDPLTTWNTGRVQTKGDWYEFRFKKTEEVVALDIKESDFVLDAPLAFDVSVSTSDGEEQRNDLVTVFHQPTIELTKDLVYKPRDMVFRVVLPEPTMAKRLRITLLDTVNERYWSIAESDIWVTDK